MSEVTLNILDAESAIHGHVHGSDAERVIAALAADPDTIGDLQRAVGRYRRVDPERPFFAGFRPGVCEEPSDAGIVFVDLAARLVACRSTYFAATRSGQVNWHDGEKARGERPRDVPLYYRLSDAWVLVDDTEKWQETAFERRRLRQASPPVDPRAVLYGKLAAGLVAEVAAATGNEEQAVRDIHARLLTTPRDDLKGQAPREVMLAQRNHISGDIESQSQHWSRIGNPPPGISQDSAAYQYAGFGTNEIVLHYRLVRYLLHACWSRFLERRGDAGMAIEIRHLEELQQEWMHSPQDDELSGRSPAQIIALERARLPWVVSGEEAMVDCDCPLCQAMAEDNSPVFCHLAGSNMENDFAFSFCTTREEWETERENWEESTYQFDAAQARRKDSGPVTDDWPETPRSVWQSTYSNPAFLDDMAPGVAVQVQLLSIGGHLAELGEDLKKSSDEQISAASLRSRYRNIRDAVAEQPWVLDAAIARFCEELDEVATCRPDLAAKCADLQDQLQGLEERNKLLLSQ